MRHENEKASRDWREIVADSYNESDKVTLKRFANSPRNWIEHWIGATKSQSKLNEVRSPEGNQPSAVCGFSLAQHLSVLSLA
jgi:hypothetical protein